MKIDNSVRNLYCARIAQCCYEQLVFTTLVNTTTPTPLYRPLFLLLDKLLFCNKERCWCEQSTKDTEILFHHYNPFPNRTCSFHYIRLLRNHLKKTSFGCYSVCDTLVFSFLQGDLLIQPKDFRFPPLSNSNKNLEDCYSTCCLQLVFQTSGESSISFICNQRN